MPKCNRSFPFSTDTHDPAVWGRDQRHHAVCEYMPIYTGSDSMSQTLSHLDELKEGLSILYLMAARLTDHLGQLHHRLTKDFDSATDSPCPTCPRYATCTEPCEALLSLLPRPQSGRSVQLTRSGVPLDDLRHDAGQDRVHQRSIFDHFIACQHLLTKKQWEAVEFVYGKGLTQRETAAILDKSESTISGLLSAATRAARALDADSLRSLPMGRG
jgi:hypothetical protein